MPKCSMRTHKSSRKFYSISVQIIFYEFGEAKENKLLEARV